MSKVFGHFTVLVGRQEGLGIVEAAGLGLSIYEESVLKTEVLIGARGLYFCC